MLQALPDFNVVIPVYEGVDLMDVAAPYEMFNWMGVYWTERAVSVTLVEAEGRVVRTRDGLKLTPDKSFDECRRGALQAQLLWVPGGGKDQLAQMMRDSCYLAFLNQQAAGADYVTSVCEGALLLASAGLLEGYRATTHWAFVSCLRSFRGVQVAEGFPRYVVDRNRVTGGGISSGLDEALELIGLVSTYEVAKQVQLVTQYFPRPPLNGDIPGEVPCPLDAGKA